MNGVPRIVSSSTVANRALKEGSYRTEPDAPEDCLVFHREIANQHVMVALNFSDALRRIEIPRASILLSTGARAGSIASDGLDLAANEAVIVEIE